MALPFDPISAGLMVLGNMNERSQQAKQGAANAEMLRYSPWTKLGGEASSQIQQNTKFNPGADLAGGIAGIFGTQKAQEQADAKDKSQQDFQNNWLQAMQNQNPQNQALNQMAGQPLGQAPNWLQTFQATRS